MTTSFKEVCPYNRTRTSFCRSATMVLSALRTHSATNDYFFASSAVTASSRPSSEWPPHTLRPDWSYSKYVGVP